MNNVNLIGRLTRAPELRAVNPTTSVATIFVATDRPKLNKDGHTYKGEDGFTVKETEYHKVTCFNGLINRIVMHCGLFRRVCSRVLYLTSHVHRSAGDRPAEACLT